MSSIPGTELATRVPKVGSLSHWIDPEMIPLTTAEVCSGLTFLER